MNKLDSQVGLRNTGQYHAAFFDLDGVLVESCNLWFHLMSRLAKDL
jgi:phosphoglycolate phosphatase-like HAD superfamily hydrolase